jgi:hypothetical protein
MLESSLLLPMAVLGLLRHPVPGERWTPDAVAESLELPEPDVRGALELLQLAGLALAVGNGSHGWIAT